MSDQPPVARVGIAGLGLIGGSIARGLRAAWPHVRIVGLDRPDVLSAARAAGAIDDACGTVTELGALDLCVLALPIPDIVSALGSLGAADASAIVTDVGSTKRVIGRAAMTARVRRFVGGHPMAGRAESGFAWADPQLFTDRRWFLTPPSDDSGAIATVEALTRALGARPQTIDPVLHDREMAWISHLPQWVASSLLQTVGDAVGDHGLAAAGAGLRDTTRLAASAGDLWSGILATNADFVAEAAQALASALSVSADSLRDGGVVRERFARARQYRAQIAPPPVR